MSKLGDWVKQNGLRTLGAALTTGVPGVLATVATSLGVPEEKANDQDAVLAAAKADPAGAAKLLEVQNQIPIAKIKAHSEAYAADLYTLRELSGLEVTSQESARDMYKETGDPTPKHITYFLLVGWALMAVGLFFVEIPAANREMVIRSQGNLEGSLATAIAFWLGSSFGSKTKDKAIAREMAEDDLLRLSIWLSLFIPAVFAASAQITIPLTSSLMT